jgi:hypothetical protein
MNIANTNQVTTPIQFSSKRISGDLDRLEGFSDFEGTDAVIAQIQRLSTQLANNPADITTKLSCFIEASWLTLENEDIDFLNKYMRILAKGNDLNFIRRHTKKVINDLKQDVGIDGIEELDNLLDSIEKDIYSFCTH